MKAIVCSVCVLALAFTPAQAEDKEKDFRKADGTQLTPDKTEATVKVGEKVYCGVKNSSVKEDVVEKLKVKVDGKDKGKLDPENTGAIGGGYANYVFKPEKPGTYTIEVTPVHTDDKEGKPVKFKVTVKAKS